MAGYPYYNQGYFNQYPMNGYYPQIFQQQTAQQAQPQMPQMQQGFAQNPMSSGIIWVDDEREAALFPVGPNAAAALWEKSGKRAYMKKADATGKPTMTVYDLVERTDGNQDSGNVAEEKTVSYAREEDLKTLVGAVKGLDSIIGNMKADIDSLKSDFYGIQGRKRIVKKQEPDTDE